MMYLLKIKEKLFVNIDEKAYCEPWRLEVLDVDNGDFSIHGMETESVFTENISNVMWSKDGSGGSFTDMNEFLDFVTPCLGFNTAPGGSGAIEPLEVASTVISFTDLTIYNSVASPATGNITNNLTGAKKGIIQKIYHNSASAPTVPAGWVLRGGGIYVPSTLNIIYATFAGGTRVEYWIA